MRIVHLVSENDRTNGYTLRTRRIVEEQLRQGIDAVVVAPSRGSGSLSDASSVLRSVSEWIQNPRITEILEMAPNCVSNAIDLAGAIGPQPPGTILHAHTPWWCALAASLSGLPWVYEVRGLQEESAVLDGRRDKNSDWFALWSSMERWARLSAHRVFAISPGLVQDAIERGARVVALTPNAVDSTQFRPLTEQERADVRHTFQLGDGPIVGYFGSIRPLEGIDELIRALPELRRRVPGVKCLVAGNGDFRPLMLRAQEHDLFDVLDYRGALEPGIVPTLLGAVDCVAITRPDSHVTRTVTPLKPLEALACGVPVVSSDLPALNFVGERGTLFYEPGNVEMLAEMIRLAIAAGPHGFGAEGREWVTQERTWEGVVKAQLKVYEEMVA